MKLKNTSLFLFFSFFSISSLMAKEESKPSSFSIPGLYQSISEINLIQRNQLKDWQRDLEKKNFLNIEDLKKAKFVKINSLNLIYFLKNTSLNYLKLYRNNLCSFLSLLENNLLNSLEKRPDFIIVDIVNDKGEWESFFVEKKVLIEFYSLHDCIRNRELNQNFNFDNLSKSIGRLNLEIPKNDPEEIHQCHKIHQKWLEAEETPYLCRYHQILSQNTSSKSSASLGLISLQSKIKAKFNQFQLLYLTNLCSHLDDEEAFCRPYVEQTVWRKIINRELPLSWMSYRCNGLGVSSIKELEQCHTNLTTNDELCLYNNSTRFPALYPLPRCSSISSALLTSHLEGEYQDCPGRMQRPDVTLFERIFLHHKKLKLSSDSSNCSFLGEKLIFEAIKENDLTSQWETKACYIDKINENEEVCLPFYLSTENTPSSLCDVIKKSLNRLKGTSKNEPCQLVENETYKPGYLKFQQGIFAVYKKNNCSNFNCPLKIFYKNSELLNISLKQNGNFTFLPFKNSDTHLSLGQILEKTLKKRIIPVQNVTELQVQLKKPSQIAWGIGCLEDIYPHFFHVKFMNQCNPTTFIIDNVQKINNKFFVTIRTHVDDVNSPRIVPWNFVFNSIKRYLNLHPLQQWNLYVFE